MVINASFDNNLRHLNIKVYNLYPVGYFDDNELGHCWLLGKANIQGYGAHEFTRIYNVCIQHMSVYVGAKKSQTISLLSVCTVHLIYVSN